MIDIKKLTVMILFLVLIFSSCNMPTSEGTPTEPGLNPEEPTQGQELVPTGSNSPNQCWPIPLSISTEDARIKYCTIDPLTGYKVSDKYYLDNDLDGKGAGNELFFCCPTTMTSNSDLKFAQMQFVYNINDDCNDEDKLHSTTLECQEAETTVAESEAVESVESVEAVENTDEIKGCTLNIGGTSKYFRIGDSNLIEGETVTLNDADDTQGCKVEVGVNFWWVTIDKPWEYNTELTIKFISIDR
jgi:hypothetical protein